MSRATCFDSIESSSGPHGSDPYNNMCSNMLWDPKCLQWYYNKIQENKMNRNILQGKVINIGELNAVDPLCGGDKVVVTSRGGVGWGGGGIVRAWICTVRA
jgi:hypothetical protein